MKALSNPDDPKIVRVLLLLFVLLLSPETKANGGSDKSEEPRYAVNAVFRCEPKDYLVPLSVFCGDNVKEVYRSVDVGLIFKSVIVDGKTVVPRQVDFYDLSLAKKEINSRFPSYEINFNGLGCYENDPDTEVGELKAFLYEIPERPDSVEIIYYSRETQEDPVLCRALFLFEEKRPNGQEADPDYEE